MTQQVGRQAPAQVLGGGGIGQIAGVLNPNHGPSSGIAAAPA